METNYSASNGQTSQKQLNVYIYCDLQNVPLSQDLAKSLLIFVKSKGKIISKKIYHNSLYQNHLAAKDELQEIGYEYRDVTCTLKNSADNQLKSDLIDDVSKHYFPNIVILISGDGDFISTVKLLQTKDIKVIIFAQKGNVKKDLKGLANEFHFIDDLPKLVNHINQTQATSIKSKINYNEAIKYLIEAIETALTQGKQTGFSRIDKLMRERCTRYQGCSSIATSNGQKFKNFSQFVDAAVKDGKVRKQNQELFLPEINRLAA
ncbi:MAG: NYN domain-containing protein [Desmonostoc vinosum HA7617-LM4]|nr:NYN domain-containing protein [Desmonostoc vinosum HA7617-LM4]